MDDDWGWESPCLFFHIASGGAGQAAPAHHELLMSCSGLQVVTLSTPAGMGRSGEVFCVSGRVV